MQEFARRLNYFSATFIAILGFSLASEIFLEKDPEDKLDDVLMLILSFISILWYKKKGLSSNSTLGSMVLIGVGIIIKLSAIFIEYKDKEAVGDDIGIMVALSLAFLFVIWQTLRKSKLLK